LAVFGHQPDEEIFGVDQLADFGMQALVELVLADVGRRQLRDVEQRHLQPFGALALLDLQLQAAIGLRQLQRALLDALLKRFVALFAFERGEDVAGDELEHRLVLGRIQDAGFVALQHQRALGNAIA
jgi:hypothetical protein